MPLGDNNQTRQVSINDDEESPRVARTGSPPWQVSDLLPSLWRGMVVDSKVR